MKRSMKPMKTVMKRPVTLPVKLLVNLPMKTVMKRSVNLPNGMKTVMKRPVNLPMKRPVNLPMKQPVKRPVKRPGKQPMESMKRPMKSMKRPMKRVVKRSSILLPKCKSLSKDLATPVELTVGSTMHERIKKRRYRRHTQPPKKVTFALTLPMKMKIRKTKPKNKLHAHCWEMVRRLPENAWSDSLNEGRRPCPVCGRAPRFCPCGAELHKDHSASALAKFGEFFHSPGNFARAFTDPRDMEEFQDIFAKCVQGLRGDVTDALLDVIYFAALTNNPASVKEIGPVVANFNGSADAIHRAIEKREKRGDGIFRGGQNPGAIKKDGLVESLKSFRAKMKPTLLEHIRGFNLRASVLLMTMSLSRLIPFLLHSFRNDVISRNGVLLVKCSYRHDF